MSSHINLAIFSPNANAYSETFIQAHKQLPFQVKYYFGGFIPNLLEGKGSLNKSFLKKIAHKLTPGSAKPSFSEQNLESSLKENNINCVLAEYGPTAAESLNVIEKLQIPLVVHFHGYDASMHDMVEKYRKTYLDVFNYAGAVVVVSNKMRADVIALGCPPEKIFLTPCGPNPAFFEVQPSFQKAQFTAIGRFVDKKAPYLTLAAFKEVAVQKPEAKLIMVGTGPLLNTCTNLAKVWGIEQQIEFTGALKPAEVVTCVEQSIAFLQHSVIASNGDSEGTPVAVLEAGAAGIPVVASRHAGIADVVINEQTGLLFEELDVKQMAAHMLRLLNDVELAKRIGANARKHVAAHYTLNQHLQAVASAVETAVQKHLAVV